MAMYSSQRAKSLDKLLDDSQWVMNMVTAEGSRQKGFVPLKRRQSASLQQVSSPTHFYISKVKGERIATTITKL